MNILIYRYNSICEPDIISGFEELGFQVDTITEEMYDKNIPASRQLSLLDQRLQIGNYQFVLSINFFPVIAEVCNIYHIPYLSIVVDSPVMELYTPSVQLPYNRIFLFDRALYDELAPSNPGNIFHLPLATNVSRWDDAIRRSSPAQRRTYSSEISFVGSLYTEKCPYDLLKFPTEYARGYVEGLLNAQNKIYGCFFLEDAMDNKLVDDIVTATSNSDLFPKEFRKNYKAILCQLCLGSKITERERLTLLSALGEHFAVDLYTGSFTGTLPVRVRGRVKTHTEMPIVFRESQINLNMTSKPIRSGLPLRIWDILGCHGFLISNYQTEIPEFLTPGEDLAVYTSKEELLELADYYLHRPAKCREIAENAYQKVREFHTWPVRLSQMLELSFFL